MDEQPPRFQPHHLLFIIVGIILVLSIVWVARRSVAIQAVPTIASTAPPFPTQTISVQSFTPIADPLLPTPTLRLSPTADMPPMLSTAVPSAPSIPPATPSDSEIDAILDRMTLEQKIGQMLMIGMPGPTLDNVTRQRIIYLGVGGIIFLESNTTSPIQVRDLTAALQSLALEQTPGVPLFIAWNHEGGAVVRRNAGLTQFPSSMAVGATGQPENAYQVGLAMAEEMRSLGVNMNFAPVLDVNTEPANPVIGLRSFGDDPAKVAAFGQRFIQGLQAGGVIAVAKHFPGHGGVDVDSHVALPTLNSDSQSLEQTELPPFKMAIETDVEGVMVAHMRIPALDPNGRPSSLSPEIVNGLLREEMGYDGVIMTDALGMGAIINHYSIEEAAVQAVLTGNDLLLTVEINDYPERIHRALLTAVQSGYISETQIDDSVRRLLRLKLSSPMTTLPDSPLLPKQTSYQELAEEIGRTAVKLLADERGWLPLIAPAHVVLISPDRLNPGTVIGDQKSALNEKLGERGLNVTELFYNFQSPANISTVQNLAQAQTTDVYIVVTWDAILRFAHNGETAQENLVNALLATGKPVVVVFGQLPYDEVRVPNVPLKIAMYGDTNGQIEGVVNLLLPPGDE